MENISQIELSNIDYRYINDKIIERYEKAFSTILFSSNHVFKVFSKKDGLYDENAATDEYKWDCSMPFLNPQLYKAGERLGGELNVLVMDRLPVQSNVLHELLDQNLPVDTIIEIGLKILALQAEYKRYDLQPDDLYFSFLSNVQLQISFLNDILSDEIKDKIICVVASDVCKNIFLNPDKNVFCSIVHGNMFTGNIFFHFGETVVIDPISKNHPSRYSYPDVDIATYLTDLRLLLPTEVYGHCFNRIIQYLPANRICLIKFYILLKLLVRIRFAYLELEMQNLTHEISMNQIVTMRGVEYLLKYLDELESEFF